MVVELVISFLWPISLNETFACVFFCFKKIDKAINQARMFGNAMVLWWWLARNLKRFYFTLDTKKINIVYERYPLNLPWNENHKLTRYGCSSLVRISISRSTLRRASLSKQTALLMYFIAYICPVSFFWTMQTWKIKQTKNKEISQRITFNSRQRQSIYITKRVR